MLPERAVHGEDARVGVVGWQQWWCSLLACCWGLLQSSGIPPEFRAGPSCLAGTEMGRGGA